MRSWHILGDHDALLGPAIVTSMRRWLLPVTQDWHDKAICRSEDPDVWKLFEPIGDREPLQWAYARAEVAIDDFCLNCPVMTQCGEERDRHEYQGVWGGEFSEKRGVVSFQTGMLLKKFGVRQSDDELGEENDDGAALA